MKKLKILIIVLVLVILSGCTVKEKVTVHSDGRVYQKVIVPVSTDNMEEEKFKSYANRLLEAYNPALEARGYAKKIEYGKKNSKIVITNNFDDICKYIDKTVFSQYVYKFISCTQTEDYYEIKNDSPHIDYCFDCLTEPALDDVTFTITFPISIESNADEISKNSYTWRFDKNTPKNKSIYLKIDKKKLKEAKKAVVEKEKEKKDLEMKIKILVGIVAVVVFIIFAIMLKKKYDKNNKLEY